MRLLTASTSSCPRTWVKKNKNRFFFVGEVEHYDSDIDELSYSIGRPVVHEQGIVNQTKAGNRPRLSSQEKQFLRELFAEEELCYQELRKLVVRRST